MDPQLKQLIKELGDAINQNLSQSELIATGISRVKDGGYDIYLVLNATIGVSKQGERAPDKTSLVTAMSSNPDVKISDQGDTLTEFALKPRSPSSVDNSRDGRGRSMDPQLKQLMKELGDAINKSLSNSEQISDVVSRIKEVGYRIFLHLDATIGVSKRHVNAPAQVRVIINVPSLSWRH